LTVWRIDAKDLETELGRVVARTVREQVGGEMPTKGAVTHEMWIALRDR